MEEIVSNMRVMDWCLVGALGLVWLLQCYFYIRYMCGVCRKSACAKVESQKSKVESQKSRVKGREVEKFERLRS